MKSIFDLNIENCRRLQSTVAARAARVEAEVARLKACSLWLDAARTQAALVARLAYRDENAWWPCFVEDAQKHAKAQLASEYKMEVRQGVECYHVQPFLNTLGILGKIRSFDGSLGKLGYLSGYARSFDFTELRAPPAAKHEGHPVGLTEQETAWVCNMHQDQAKKLLTLMRELSTSLVYIRRALDEGALAAPEIVWRSPDIETRVASLESLLCIPGTPPVAPHFSSHSRQVNSLSDLPTAQAFLDWALASPERETC